MKLSAYLLFVAASFGSWTPGPAMAEPSMSAAVQDVRTKVYELFGKDTATVSFESGRANISEEERRNLAAVVSAVRADATIASAVVGAWSDKDFPGNKGQQLSTSERRLADERVAAVKDLLINLGVSSFETYTMAESVSWMGRLFNTDDAKVKGEGRLGDANDQVAAEIGRVLRDKGGPGKAVVIIRRAGTLMAH